MAAQQPEKALPLLYEYLAIQKKQFVSQPSRFAGFQADVANRLLKAGQSVAAEPILRECLATREKNEPGTWTTFNTRSMLGGALLGQQKYAEAEPLLLQGYTGLKQRANTIPAAGQVRLPEGAERLAKLYEAWDKPADAAKWWAELADVQWAIADSPPPAPPKP